MVTVLLVSRGQLARADLAGGSVSVRRSLPAALEGSFLESLEAAAALGNGMHGPVFVLTDEVFTQAISVAAGAVKGLKEEDLARALSFEAQTFSGIAAENSAVAWRTAGTGGREAEFWVTQMPRTELDQLTAAVRRLGGRLSAVLHPAGLPRRLSPGQGRWNRIEYWHDLTARVQSSEGGSVTVQAGRGDLPRRSGEAAIAQPPSEILLATARPAARTDATTLRLDDEVALKTWLSGWVQVLQEPSPPVPLLKSTRRVLSRKALLSIGAAFLALVSGACAFHYFPRRAEQARLQAEIGQAEESSRRATELKKQFETSEAEVFRLRALASTGWSRVPARMLDVVSSRCPSGLVVDELETGWDRSVLRGICREPVLADRFAEALARDLAADNLRVSSPTKSLKRDGPSAGLYDFRIEVLPAPATAAMTPLKPGP